MQACGQNSEANLEKGWPLSPSKWGCKNPVISKKCPLIGLRDTLLFFIMPLLMHTHTHAHTPCVIYSSLKKFL